MTIAALIAGFAFSGVSEIELPNCEGVESEDCVPTPDALQYLFYCLISVVFAAELHVMIVGGVCVVGGHAVAMRGTGGTPNDSVDRGMAGMRKSAQ